MSKTIKITLCAQVMPKTIEIHYIVKLPKRRSERTLEASVKVLISALLASLARFWFKHQAIWHHDIEKCVISVTCGNIPAPGMGKVGCTQQNDSKMMQKCSPARFTDHFRKVRHRCIGTSSKSCPNPSKIAIRAPRGAKGIQNGAKGHPE